MDKEIKISERLKHVASFVTKGAFLADIGSDHAYLPAHICSYDPTLRAIAGEVREGPYLNALDTVERFQLQEQIEVRLGNGMEVVDGRVTEVTIAGMGGSLIQTILLKDQDKLLNVQKIIAQPNNQERAVRETFQQLDFVLTNERIIEENGHIYEIIVGEKSGTSCYDESEDLEKQLTYGPSLLKEKHPLFIEKWQREYEALQLIQQQIQAAKQPPTEKLNIIQQQLKEIEEMIRS